MQICFAIFMNLSPNQCKISTKTNPNILKKNPVEKMYITLNVNTLGT